MPKAHAIQNRAAVDLSDLRFAYDVENKAGSNPAIRLRGVIGVSQAYNEYGGDYAGTFRELEAEIESLGDADEIDLYIFSNGGYVWPALALHNLIERHPARFNGIVDGLAASAATIILMACDTITVPKNAQLMIHNAANAVAGDYREMERMAKMLRRETRNIANIYVDRILDTVGDAEDRPSLLNRVLRLMDEETYFTGEEAVAMGLADRADEEVDLPSVLQNHAAHLGSLNLAAIPDPIRPLFDRPALSNTASEQITVMSEESAPAVVDQEPAAPAADPVAPAAPENVAAPAVVPAVENAGPAGPTGPTGATGPTEATDAVPSGNDAAIAEALTNFSQTLTALTEKLEAQSGELENLKNFQASGANPSAWGNHAPAAAPATPSEPANELSPNATPHEKISFGLRNMLGKNFDAPRRA